MGGGQRHYRWFYIENDAKERKDRCRGSGKGIDLQAKNRVAWCLDKAF